MESITFFDFLDYSIVIAILLIAIFVLICFLKKTKTKFNQNLITSSSKMSIVSSIIGIVFLIISALLIVYVERDIAKTIDFFKPIPIMTSEPIIIFSFALFLFGLVLIILAVHRNILIKKLLKA